VFSSVARQYTANAESLDSRRESRVCDLEVVKWTVPFLCLIIRAYSIR